MASGSTFAPDRVSVWFAALEPGALSGSVRAGLSRHLDEATRARVARYRSVADQDRSLVTHALLRRLLAAVVDREPASLQLRTRCRTCGTEEHGKPYLPGDPTPPVQFNVSHSATVAMVALAPAGCEVGVDVESRTRAVDWPAMRRSVFTDQEWQHTCAAPDPDQARVQLWARKEASVKVTGHGLARSLRSVQVLPPEQPHEAGPRWFGRHEQDTVQGWDLTDQLAGELGVVAAVAAAPAGPATPSVRLSQVQVGALADVAVPDLPGMT